MPIREYLSDKKVTNPSNQSRPLAICHPCEPNQEYEREVITLSQPMLSASLMSFPVGRLLILCESNAEMVGEKISKFSKARSRWRNLLKTHLKGSRRVYY